MRTLRRARKWLTGTLVGASRYLESVFVAVLLAPVLPEIAVDVLGRVFPHWLLRCAAVLTVLLLCMLVHYARRCYARRRQREAPMPKMGHYKVLVQPMSPSYTYYSRDKRERDPAVPEVTVDAARPRLVIAVVSREYQTDKQQQMRRGLAADDVEVEIVEISNVNEVDQAVREASQKVLALLRERKVKPEQVCFDTTGGTVPMSFAMLRAAALYGSDCCYVSSKYIQGERQPYTQCARSFNPVELVPAPE